MKVWMRCVLLGWALGAVGPPEALGEARPLDHIQRTGRLWGIREIRVNPDGSVTLVDDDGQGPGQALVMLGLNNEVVTEVTLGPSQSCSVTDRAYIFVKYEIQAVSDQEVTVVVREVLRPRSFLDELREESRTVKISAYTTAPEPAAEPTDVAPETHSPPSRSPPPRSR